MAESVNNVAIFITKLWKMLNQEETVNIMVWNSTGQSFIIKDQVLFITKLLPTYFKHNNMGSFIRQLNLYDFHKIYSDNNAELEFQHKFFQRDKPDLLKYIKRKLPQYKHVICSKIDRDGLINLSKEMASMKKKQEDLIGKMNFLHEENLTVLKRLASIQAKCNTQNQILRKIVDIVVPFLETCYVPKYSHRNDSCFDNSQQVIGINSNINEKNLNFISNDFLNDKVFVDKKSIDFWNIGNVYQNNIDKNNSGNNFFNLKDSFMANNDQSTALNEKNNRVWDQSVDQNNIKFDTLSYVGTDFSALLDAGVTGDSLLNDSNKQEESFKIDE